MDETAKQFLSPQIEQKLSFSLSSNLQKTEHTELSEHSGTSWSDFPLLQTLQRTTSCPPSESSLQKNGGVMSTSEDSGFQENPTEQTQETKLKVTPFSTLCDNTKPRHLPDKDFIMAGRHLLHGGKDEHLTVPKIDEPSFCPGDETDTNLASFSNGTSCHLRKSPEDQTSGGDILTPAGNNVKLIIMNGIQIQADTCSAKTNEVQCHSGFKEEEKDTEFKIVQIQSFKVAETEEMNKLELDKNNLGDDRSKNVTPHNYYAELKHNCSLSKGEASCSSSEIEQIVTVNHVNEIDLTKLIPYVAEYSEGPVLACYKTSIRNAAMEKVSFEPDDVLFAKSEPVAVEIKAKCQSEAADHTTETPTPACQDPAEGDNDVGSIDVIDPEFQSGVDKEAEKKCCTLSVTLHVDQPSSVSRGEEKLFPHQCPAGRPSENPFCISVDKTQKETDFESLSNLPAASVARCTLRQSCDTVHHGLKADTQAVDRSPGDCDEMECLDGIRKIKEIGHFVEQIECAGNGRSEDNITQMTYNKNYSDTTDAEKPNQDLELKLVQGEGEKKIELLSDRPSNTDFGMMDLTSGENTENQVHIMEEEMRSDNSVTQETSEHDVQQENECIGGATMPLEYICDLTEGQKSSFCSKKDQEENFPSFYENKDDRLALALPSKSDAVVPSQCDFKPSQYALDSFAESNKFSQLPPALTLCGLNGFESFEKIQLLPNDDTDAIFIPVFSSSPKQRLQTIQESSDPCGPIVETNKQEEMENSIESLTSSSGLSELLNFNTPKDALGCCELVTSFESACDQSESDMNPQSEFLVSGIPKNLEFEMKKEFDKVLKELNLFFDISRADFSPSSPQQWNDGMETEKDKTSEGKEIPHSPDKMHQFGDVTAGDTIEDNILEICEDVPLRYPSTIVSESEQEVPLSSNLCQETSMETSGTQRECCELELREKTWSPTVACLPILEQLSHRPPRRPEPLKTCTRPIRVGLSKRAKTKHLHRCHPYK